MNLAVDLLMMDYRGNVGVCVTVCFSDKQHVDCAWVQMCVCFCDACTHTRERLGFWVIVGSPTDSTTMHAVYITSSEVQLKCDWALFCSTCPTEIEPWHHPPEKSFILLFFQNKAHRKKKKKIKIKNAFSNYFHVWSWKGLKPHLSAFIKRIAQTLQFQHLKLNQF